MNPLDDPLVQEALRRAGRNPETLQLTVAEEKANFDPDLLPDVGPLADRSQEDMEIDAVLDRIDILDAYQRWCGKMTPKVGSKRESIMISCPKPSHRDNDPSAWVNLDKQTWMCGPCQEGGDKYDIAAWYFGYDVPGYKGKDFPQLRRDMAIDLGYTISRTGTKEYLEPSAPVEHSSVTSVDNPVDKNIVPDEVQSPLAEVIPISEDLSEIDSLFDLTDLAIDWQTIFPKGTFLYEWMEATTIDDLPHEYYALLGLQAIGCAAGNDVWLADIQWVKPNLFVCLLGGTGTGKSRALNPYMRMIEEALPWDGDDYTPSTGVQLLSSPASAEALLDMFEHPIKDQSTQQIIEYAPVRGLLRVEEFASFVARASRPTNPMKETLIELYDIGKGRTMKHRSRTGGTVQAYSPFAQMVTTTQPKAIHAYLRRTDTESGFLNRWVFAAGNRRTARISYGGVPTDVTQAAQMLRDLRAWCSTGREMSLAGPALAVWDNFFHDEIVPLQDQEDESMLSRIDLLLKKFIVLFTVNAKEPQPTAQTVGQAISLFPYIRRTTMMFAKNIMHNDQEECRQRILKILASSPKGATMSIILKKLAGHHEIGLIANTLRIMRELGEIVEKSGDGRGPAKARYHIVV